MHSRELAGRRIKGTGRIIDVELVLSLALLLTMTGDGSKLYAQVSDLVDRYFEESCCGSRSFARRSTSLQLYSVFGIQPPPAL